MATRANWSNDRAERRKSRTGSIFLAGHPDQIKLCDLACNQIREQRDRRSRKGRHAVRQAGADEVSSAVVEHPEHEPADDRRDNLLHARAKSLEAPLTR